MSIMPSPLRSRCAAMPIIAPIVTTPVPPMPVTMMLKVRSIAGMCGSGRVLLQCRGIANSTGLAGLGAVHGHEGRAETIDAGEVLVAA